MSNYFGIPVTIDSWIAFFWLSVGLIVALLLLLIMDNVRSHRLGVLFPKDIVGIEIEGELYQTRSLIPGKIAGTLETPTRDVFKKRIYEKREHTIIKSAHGGPTLALLSGKDRSTIDVNMRQYAVLMKEGRNPYNLRFDTLAEAALYVDENFLLKQEGLPAEFIKEEQERIRQARSFVTVDTITLTNTLTETPPDIDKPIVQRQTKETKQTRRLMNETEYQAFMRDLHSRIRNSDLKILPLEICGEAISFEDYVRWVDSLSRADTAEQERREGYLERGDLMAQIASVMPFVMVILAITVGAGMFIAVLRLVH